MMLTVNWKSVSDAVSERAFSDLAPELAGAHETLAARTGLGAAFTDWLTWPGAYDRAEYDRLKAAAARIRSDSKALVVIGIGGSYLGARAVIEALGSPNYNLKQKDTPDIFFAGNNLSASYLREIIALIGDRDFSVNVISKSGTTTEPAVAFRLLKTLLEDRFGPEGARRRIYATTDKARGALRGLAERERYETFVIPDGIGGRFSVLTPVGLLPIAAAGVDTDALLKGARDAMQRLDARALADNPAWQYAAARTLLYRAGKTVEVLACYEPCFRFVGEWWKQLFGESEGKEQGGLLPVTLDLTADLHSMGQYMQQGLRNLLETVVVFDTPDDLLSVPFDPEDADGLNFLSGMRLFDINRRAFEGTYLAHVDGGVPNVVVHVPKLDAYHLGALLHFFMLSCGLSGTMLGVNPFDQPGVEAYKANMFALLGKPGYEKQGAALRARL
ncbi:MAG: glucose-6-phosphate isomerase [Oscillospiraceae bacterium]|jgi:glucose-6-phosphate isomerase|nr:glucose-6-phosphate isomerase [Oscillospiraceae bacterium]